MFKIKLPNKRETKEINSANNVPPDNSSPNRSPLDKNKDAYQTGLNIANVITYFWNSQKKPGKVYISNRRVHHGEIGSLLGLSNLFKKLQPTPTGILSGLGEGLVKDDYADKDEWFTFKRKKKDEPQSSETNTNAAPTSEKKE
jgi:hypothetical protein